MRLSFTISQSQTPHVETRYTDIFPAHQSTAYNDYEVTNYYHIDHVQYNPVTLKTFNGGRQAPLLLSASDMFFVRTIQPQDEHGADTKMNWIGWGAVESKGRPCWMKGDGSYKCDSMIYGCSFVRVRMDTAIEALFEFTNNRRDKQMFYLLDPFTRAMKDMELGEFQDYDYKFIANDTMKIIHTRVRRNVIPLIEQGFIQVCTEHQLSANGNKEVATERGIKLFPVWSPVEGVQYPEWEYRIWARAVGL